jgi:glycosyltransferase involved in cell wall biosynthesis
LLQSDLEAKKLDLLVRAVAELKQRGHEVNVILIGDGPERPSLVELAKKLGVRVHFAGACYDELTIARFTLASNVTVSPGAPGLTVVQSLAYGRPILTGDASDQHLPEVEAILPGFTGNFFPADDVTGLAEMMAAYTKSSHPHPSVQAACHRVVECFYNPDYQVSVFRRAIAGEVAQRVSVQEAIGDGSVEATRRP